MDMKDPDFLEFEIWLTNGVERGWVSEVFCDTHDGAPMSDEEMQEFAYKADDKKKQRA